MARQNSNKRKGKPTHSKNSGPRRSKNVTDRHRYGDHLDLTPEIVRAQRRLEKPRTSEKPPTNGKGRVVTPMLFRKPDVHSSQHTSSILSGAGGSFLHNHDPLRFTVLGPLVTRGKIKQYGPNHVENVFDGVASERDEGFEYKIAELFVGPSDYGVACLGVTPQPDCIRELNLDIRALNQGAEEKWNDFEHGSRAISIFNDFDSARAARANIDSFLESTNGVLCKLSGVIVAPKF